MNGTRLLRPRTMTGDDERLTSRAGTRVIVRRERPHPGAQLTLFDTVEDIDDADIAGLKSSKGR